MRLERGRGGRGDGDLARVLAHCCWLWLKRGNRARPSTIEAPSAKEGNLLGTSLALAAVDVPAGHLVSARPRCLGRRARHRAHGVVLKVWLLFVLAAEAPAVAGQVSAGYLATGRGARGARSSSGLVATVTIGLITAAALAAAAGPIRVCSFPTDTAAAKSTKTYLRWARSRCRSSGRTRSASRAARSGPLPLFGRRDARQRARRVLCHGGPAYRRGRS